MSSCIPSTKIQPTPPSGSRHSNSCSRSAGVGRCKWPPTSLSTSTKRPFKLAAPVAAALVETWLAFPTVDITPALFRVAVDIQQRFQLSYWDAAILAAARQIGCCSVYSEDLNAGQNY